MENFILFLNRKSRSAKRRKGKSSRLSRPNPRTSRMRRPSWPRIWPQKRPNSRIKRQKLRISRKPTKTLRKSWKRKRKSKYENSLEKFSYIIYGSLFFSPLHQIHTNNHEKC